MGSSNNIRKKHLTSKEIQIISSKQSSLQIIFNQNKNANGMLEVKDLENIFENKLSLKLLKKLYKLCQTEKNKFNLEDLKYLYSLFMTNNYEAKLNFITDLIFIDKIQLTIEDYKKRIQFIYGKSRNIFTKLSSEEFITNMFDNKKITKENFIKNLENQHKSFIEKFSFFGEEEKEENPIKSKEDKLILSSNNVIVCECNQRKTKISKTENLKINTEV